MKKNMLVSLAIACAAGVAQAENPHDTMKKVASVVARVGDVWKKDGRYDAFQKDLAGDFSDTPSLEQFKSEETWVSIRSSKSVTFTGIYKVRSKSEMNLKVGDIVEARVIENKNAKSYKELSEVTKVLCRSEAEDYQECLAAHPLSWFDKAGNKLELSK